MNKILLCGCGNMGGAMLRGWMNSGVNTMDIMVLERKHFDRVKFDGITFISEITESLLKERIACIVIAVKPSHIEPLLTQLDPLIKLKPMILSVVAGKNTDQFSLYNNPVVRVMPNTPSAINQGNLVMYKNSYVDSGLKRFAESLMEPLGLNFWIEDESMMDLMTAVSGSGPAYVFYFMKLLKDRLIKGGIDPMLSDQLVLNLISGSVAYKKVTGKSLEDLIDQVTSPGGTTEAALNVLRDSGELDTVIHKALDAAIERSKNL
jgi:pyrroline-5-carboxylate reductase